MKGSDKQILWARDIKAKIDFDALIGKGRNAEANRIIEKAVTYIENNDNAAFWIDYRGRTAMDLCSELMSRGLQIRGFGFDHRAKMALDGTITVTWKVIVQDGKDGHYELRSKTL